MIEKFPTQEDGEGQGAERSEQIKEKERHVGELLYPTGNRDDLSAFIKKMIYGQAINLEIREEEAITEGFDPELLEKEGRIILEEVEKLIKKSERSSLNPEEQKQFNHLYGLTRSVVQEPTGTGEMVTLPIRHSALTAGLMFKVSGDFRKSLKASLEPDEAKQDQIILGREDVEVTSTEIFEFVKLRNSGEKVFKGVRERQEALIKRIDRKTPAGKSMPKLFTGYLNSEAFADTGKG